MELNRRQFLKGFTAGAASLCISPPDTLRALHRKFELVRDEYPAPTYIDFFSPIEVPPNLGNDELRNAIQTRLNDSFLNHGPKVRAFHEAVGNHFFSRQPATESNHIDIAPTVGKSVQLNEDGLSITFDPKEIPVPEKSAIVFAFQTGMMTARVVQGNLDVDGGYTASGEMNENWGKLKAFGTRCKEKDSVLVAAAGNNSDDVAYLTKDDQTPLPFVMAAEFDSDNNEPRSGVRLPDKELGLSAYYVDNAAFLRRMGGVVPFDSGSITDATGSTFSTATLAAMVDVLRAYGLTDLSEIMAHLDVVAETKSFVPPGSQRGAEPKNYKVITPESATNLQNYLLKQASRSRSRAV